MDNLKAEHIIVKLMVVFSVYFFFLLFLFKSINFRRAFMAKFRPWWNSSNEKINKTKTEPNPKRNEQLVINSIRKVLVCGNICVYLMLTLNLMRIFADRIVNGERWIRKFPHWEISTKTELLCRLDASAHRKRYGQARFLSVFIEHSIWSGWNQMPDRPTDPPTIHKFYCKTFWGFFICHSVTLFVCANSTIYRWQVKRWLQMTTPFPHTTCTNSTN